MAPGVEPVQGAPRKSMPAFASSSCTWRLEAGLTVLASTTISPLLPPSLTPSGPRMTCSDISESPTQRKTHSACWATSAGVAQAFPPSAASFSAFPFEFDQSATSCPALIRLRAIGAPISPSPRNPSFAIKEDCTSYRLVGQAFVPAAGLLPGAGPPLHCVQLNPPCQAFAISQNRVHERRVPLPEVLR